MVIFSADLHVDLWEISPEPNPPPTRHRPSRERSTTPDWSPDMGGSLVHVSVSVSVCTRGEGGAYKRHKYDMLTFIYMKLGEIVPKLNISSQCDVRINMANDGHNKNGILIQVQ